MTDEIKTNAIIFSIPETWPYWRLEYLLRLITYNTKYEIKTNLKGNRIKITGEAVDIIYIVSNLENIRDESYKGVQLFLRDRDQTKWLEIEIPYRDKQGQDENTTMAFNYGLLPESEQL